MIGSISKVVFAFTLLILSANDSTASIVVYDFTGDSLSPSSTDSLVSATAISDNNLANFFVNSTLGYGTGTVLQVSSPSGITTPGAAVSGDHYFSFIVTPDSGVMMDFASLTFVAARGGGGTPRGWEVRSSVDSFSSTLGTADVPTVRPMLSPFSVDLSSASFDNLGGAVEFRIYTYSPDPNNTVEYDNFVLEGIAASSVPEPTSMLLFVSAIGILTKRRR